METKLGSSIFYNDSQLGEQNKKQESFILKNQSRETKLEQKIDQEGLWSLHFDGAMRTIGVGAGI